MNILKELAKAIKNIFTNKQGMRLMGIYTVEFITADGETIVKKNIVPDEGLKYFLGAGVGKTAQVSQFYIGLFTGNYNPVATDTAATFPANATEFTGYSETTRQLWDLSGVPSVTTTTVSNTGFEATFTLTAAATISGAFLSTASGKGALTGTLCSGIKFPGRALNAGDKIRVGYGLTFISQ